jgi:hypothetical protein
VRGVEHEHEEADGAAHLGSGRIVASEKTYRAR